jgi:Ca2+-binding EF-hand superfamily protein
MPGSLDRYFCIRVIIVTIRKGFPVKRLLIAVIISLFCYLPGFAAENDFKKIDTNNDGKISKQEYIAAVIKTFNKYDKNKDGFLTKDEIKAIRKIDIQKFLEEVDKNKDGKVSQEEFVKAAENRFKLLDKNKDGFIDQQEWEEFRQSLDQDKPKTSPVAPFVTFSF